MYNEYKSPPCGQDNCSEAVSIEAQRIFDTCSERDCISDLVVTLDEGSVLTDEMTIVKTRCVEVSAVCIAVECVPFKQNCYAVDIIYTFAITMDAYEQPCGDDPVTLTGTAVWNKRVILYGGKGNVKTFDSENPAAGAELLGCNRMCDKPRVTVSVVEPIALETRIDCITSSVNCDTVQTRGILISIGLFSVIRILRPVSVTVPTYQFCIPNKECCVSGESPKDIFCRLDFPSDVFFPGACCVKPIAGADIPPERPHNNGNDCCCNDGNAGDSNG